MQKCMFNILNMRSVWRGVYWSFINSKEYTNKCIGSWNKVYFKATIESKLQDFQYKILTRTLVTNRWLFKCKIINNDLCHFCKLEPETIEHLFRKCIYTQNLLTFIKNKFSA